MAGMVRVESERGQAEDRMRYLSVCSGIEAATVAWHPLGWEAAAYSEIEAFPSAVLAHHYPEVPNLGDMTKYKEWDSERIGAIDVLVGGTPCQSFSIAGLRKGLEDPRGSLMLTYLGIAASYRPRWIVWENVPGVLSSNGGRDFGAFLGALGQLGYEWSYRVLDAQWFGVAQRRKRVFVVAHIGNEGRSKQVLFKRESVCRNTPPSRKAEKETAGTITVGTGIRYDGESQTFVSRINYCAEVTGTLAAADGPKGVSDQYSHEGKLIAISCMSSGQANAEITENICPTLSCLHEAPIVVDACKSFYVSDARKRGTVELRDQFKALTSQANGGDTEPCVVCEPSMGVRRLTPRECERLQGFPDDYTMIQWRKKPAGNCPDGPRYKALGNSMAVPVMHWIGKRIAEVEAHG
jgi:DNA (cytosine-5)-methyltransferase 1